MPCSPLQAGDGELDVDLHHTEDGRLVLLVYSSLDRLVEGCGVNQPWAQLPVTDLDRIQELTGFELVLLDGRIPQHLRRGEDEP